MVVDNHVAIVGGRNLADEYFGNHDDANFRDIEVLTAGPAVLLLSRQFDDYWNSDWSFPVDRIITVEPAMSPEEYEDWILTTVAHGLNEDPAVRAAAWIQTARAAVAGEVLVLGDAPASQENLRLSKAGYLAFIRHTISISKTMFYARNTPVFHE